MTQLEEKQELIRKIECLSSADIQKLKAFLAGIEVGKVLNKQECEGRDY